MLKEDLVVSPLHKLAWQIWSSTGDSVAIEDSEIISGLNSSIHEGVIQKNENSFSFASEFQLILNAAQYLIRTEDALLTSDPRACFQRLDEIYGKEIEEENKVSAHILAYLHNNNKIDAYSWGRQAINAGINVYDVLHLLEIAIGFFEHAEAESIFRFFGNELLKHDITGGAIYTNLEIWLTKHPGAALDVKRLHEERPSKRTFGLYACSLHGLIDKDFEKNFDLVILASRSPNQDISGPAVHILGLLDYRDSSRHSYLDKAINVCSEIIHAPGHSLLAIAVRTLSNLVSFKEEIIIGLMSEVSKLGTQDASFALSEFLLKNRKSYRETEWFWRLLLSLISSTYEHTLSNIDTILEKWAIDPVQCERVLEFINCWISRQKDDSFVENWVEITFSSTIHKLIGRPGLLDRIITEWFINENFQFSMAAQKLISRLRIEGVKHFQFSADIIDNLSQDEIRFLIRRVLGYLFDESVLLSLIFSLARTKNSKSKTFGFVTTALLDFVAYDYPRQTLDYLDNIQKNESESREIKEFCGGIHSKLKERMAILDDLPNLKEFHCSSIKVKAQRFFKERYRQIDKVMNEADKKSILGLIASRVHVKGGRRTFNSFNGKFSEMGEFKEASFSTAIPLSEIFDPVGAARQRILFRRSKKGDK